eukprot:Skav232054  [mRNA]  locus=scaffold1641:39367:41051:+ [translate_table: standard]
MVKPHGIPFFSWFSRHDFGRGPARPVARPLDSSYPVPPGEKHSPGRPRSSSRARTPGRPRTPETPPEPMEQPSLRKVTATQMPPPIIEATVRQGSDQSTTAPGVPSTTTGLQLGRIF